MKEKILEMIIAKSGFAQSNLLRNTLAEEIDILTHSHYMEFARWLGTDPLIKRKDGIYKLIYETHMSTEQVYEYWLTEIKNKQNEEE